MATVEATRKARQLYERWGGSASASTRETQWPGEIFGCLVKLGALQALHINLVGGKVIRWEPAAAGLFCTDDGKAILARLDAPPTWRRFKGKITRRFPAISKGDTWTYCGLVRLVGYRSSKWSADYLRYFHDVTGTARLWLHSSGKAILIDGLRVTARGLTG